MAKFETIICAMTWGLMNALVLAIAFDAAAPMHPVANVPPVQIASASPTTAA